MSVFDSILSGFHSWLPAYVLNRSPFVMTVYDMDFLNHLPAFRAALPSGTPAFILIQLGWQHETDAEADSFSLKIKECILQNPEWKITVLTNSPKEEEQLCRRGIHAVFCHQNAFLDERRYPLLRNPKKKYDAIYIARISPFKRHLLAEKITSLRLIGTHSGYETKYFTETMTHFTHADWKEKIYSFQVAGEIQKARCGLCLSAEEGAMFVSAEYLLSGIPIVNTENLGGRDFMFPAFAVRGASDADSVANAVNDWKKEAPDPREIRSAFLELASVHRNTLREILGSLTGKPWEHPFPHKLGLRTFLFPWERFRNGVVRHDS